MDPKKQNNHLKNEDDLENLGLDADHSSDNFSVNGQYNTDNDQTTENLGSENDFPPDEDISLRSPLDEK